MKTNPEPQLITASPAGKQFPLTGEKQPYNTPVPKLDVDSPKVNGGTSKIER